MSSNSIYSNTQILLNLFHGQINNHYLNRYKKIVIHYTQNLDNNSYLEKHHILPKCMFPEYKKDKSNIIAVPARVHFILHYLLYKSFGTSKMWNAFRMMKVKSKNHKTRYLNSKLYASLKSMRPKASDLVKLRASETHTGKILTIETKAKMSSWQKGKPKLHRLGAKHSAETIAKMRGPCTLITCPHCGKTGGNNIMPRYHFNNCKQYLLLKITD